MEKSVLFFTSKGVVDSGWELQTRAFPLMVVSSWALRACTFYVLPSTVPFTNQRMMSVVVLLGRENSSVLSPIVSNAECHACVYVQ